MKPKPNRILKILICIIAFEFASSSKTLAQCSGGLQSENYYINLNGTGNNTWGFFFPQFDPSIGTLVAVDIRYIVSVNINYQIQNTGAGLASYNVKANRFDSLTVTSPGPDVILTNTDLQNVGSYSLQPGADTVGAGTNASPQFFHLLAGYVLNDSITSSVVGFLGTGHLTLYNNPSTSLSVTGGSYSLTNSFIDTMKVSLTYYYCNPDILPINITDFSVSKEAGPFAKIQWEMQNEIEGRKYIIQQSRDGINFDNTGLVYSIPSDNMQADYIYHDHIAPGFSGELYFRLKEINPNGYSQYSEVKTLDISNFAGMYLYPNPANNFININFGEGSTSGWDVAIIAADGSTVQRGFYPNTPNALIRFSKPMPKGIYFVRLFNLDQQKFNTLEFCVQ